MLTFLLVSAIAGSPLLGCFLGLFLACLKGWQMLILLEVIPAVIYGTLLLYFLPDWSKDVKWLSPDEKRALTEQYEK
jgi:MFS family permease